MSLQSRPPADRNAVEDQIAAAQEGVRELRRRLPKLDEDALDVILAGARTHNGWTDRPVGEATLRRLYELVSAGPTSNNCNPARFVFVTSAEGKERLAARAREKNAERIRSAPVTVIIGYDTEFWRALPRLFPHEDRTARFRDKPDHAEETAFRNGTLQAAYLIIAARALGLDCGPMSGFSKEKVDAEFFAGTTVKSNFLCILGHGDESRLFQKLPRLDFDEACRWE